jgi:hypothetical protein
LRLAWILLARIWNSDRRERAPVMESAAVSRQAKIPGPIPYRHVTRNLI